MVRGVIVPGNPMYLTLAPALLASASPLALADSLPVAQVPLAVAVQGAQDMAAPPLPVADQPLEEQPAPAVAEPPLDPSNTIVVDANAPAPPGDPLEDVNIQTYEITQSVDQALVAPVAEVYEDDIPKPIRNGLRNFLRNLMEPVNFLNFLLQLQPGKAMETLGRFAINTTIGIGGLFDIAGAAGLPYEHEDFGQTLGVWGVPSGPYFVIPFLGPSSARDAPARYVDPRFFYDRDISNVFLRNSLFILDVVRSRASVLRADKVLEEAGAIDEYAFVRDAWLQRRLSQVHDGRPPKPKDDD